MPPPQCPECGRFLATAFVEQITSEPAPCPGCGTELSLAPGAPGDAGAEPEDMPPVPPPAATLPAEEAAGAGDALDEGEAEASADDAEDVADDAEDVEDDVEAPATPPAPADVEPEPDTSVRPPDRTPDRDPLEGWDQSGTFPAPADEPDPVVLAAGAGIGLVLGMLLGGREHRGLGAVLGAALGAVLSRLRG